MYIYINNKPTKIKYLRKDLQRRLLHGGPRVAERLNQPHHHVREHFRHRRTHFLSVVVLAFGGGLEGVGNQLAEQGDGAFLDLWWWLLLGWRFLIQVKNKGQGSFSLIPIPTNPLVYLKKPTDLPPLIHTHPPTNQPPPTNYLDFQ
jgi:hypothetical protein